MIKLKVDNHKRLTLYSKIDIYTNENDFDHIQVSCDCRVTENDICDYSVELVFNINGTEVLNTLTIDSEKDGYIIFNPIPISSDLTTGKGSVNVYVRFVKDGILGKTNSLSIFIYENGKDGHQITEETLTATSANGYKYATSSTAGTVKASLSYGISVIPTGHLVSIAKTYQEYESSSSSLFISKGTLGNVLTGKNLETANNKVTSISNTSTNTEYPSAKAVYDYIQSLDGNGVGY